MLQNPNSLSKSRFWPPSPPPHLLNILLKVLCDDCEGEILATQEDNASLKEVKVCLTLCATYFATFVRLMMQASLQTGWWREENWVLPILILASATLLLLLLFQVSFIAFIKVIKSPKSSSHSSC